jgi:quercetin dioxygenase-like cupin family protein
MNRTPTTAIAIATVALVAVTGMGVASQTAKPNPEERNTTMQIQIQRVGSQASVRGPADWFTGTVRLDPMFDAEDPSRVSGASVSFEPGARTAWHTHPLGQHIIITSGLGWVQQEGGEIQEVRPGDVVWFPPAVKHWHGATPENAMTHIAIQESQDGSPVDWLEKVSDEQYRR